MDSLYVRLKFGIPNAEFQELFGFVRAEEILSSGAVERIHSTFAQGLKAGERTVVPVTTVRIADRHKFLEWAKNCGMYDDIALDSLEYLICQELMNEAS